MTALIVDDEPSDLDPTRAALEAAGYRTLTAASTEEALQKFTGNATSIDLAVLDISLPGRNGVELFQDLLRLNPEMRVLFVSGHVGAEVIRFYGLRASGRNFLKKPFYEGALLARVGEVMSATHRLRLEDFESSHTRLEGGA